MYLEALMAESETFYLTGKLTTRITWSVAAWSNVRAG